MYSKKSFKIWYIDTFRLESGQKAIMFLQYTFIIGLIINQTLVTKIILNHVLSLNMTKCGTVKNARRHYLMFVRLLVCLLLIQKSFFNQIFSLNFSSFLFSAYSCCIKFECSSRWRYLENIRRMVFYTHKTNWYYQSFLFMERSRLVISCNQMTQFQNFVFFFVFFLNCRLGCTSRSVIMIKSCVFP